MDLDVSKMDPNTAIMAQSFATSVSQMPTEALQFLVELLTQELASRD